LLLELLRTAPMFIGAVVFMNCFLEPVRYWFCPVNMIACVFDS
jgi:hypothetical protein